MSIRAISSAVENRADVVLVTCDDVFRVFASADVIRPVSDVVIRNVTEGSLTEAVILIGVQAVHGVILACADKFNVKIVEKVCITVVSTPVVAFDIKPSVEFEVLD